MTLESLSCCRFLGRSRFSLSCSCAVVLDAPLTYSLDDCIEYIQEDELVEVTPLSVRMCKNPKIVKKK